MTAPVSPVMRTLTWRAAVSVGSLLAITWLLDVGAIVARLGQMQARWVGLALAVSVIQVAASAWRWRFTAGRLGLALPFRDAIREYYLAGFLNQALPGGVVGDASRAWRHARTQETRGPAVRAVILERASGQLVMTVVAVASVATLPFAVGVGGSLVWIAAGVAAIAGIGLGAWWRRRCADDESLAGRLWRDTRDALLAPAALPVQVTSSVLVVGSYVATYVIAARAVGIDTPLDTLLPLVAPVLVAMLLPVTIAGWGVREGAAAVLWRMAGLTAADGVVISVAYGLIVLVSTLPGGLVLAWTVLLRPPRVAEVEVEQDVVAKPEDSAGWPQRLVERLDRPEHEGGATRSDEQRRDGDLQAVDHPGVDKA